MLELLLGTGSKSPHTVALLNFEDALGSTSLFCPGFNAGATIVAPTGAAIDQTDAKFGASCINFNATNIQSLVIDSNVDQAFNTDFTFEMFIKRPAVTSAANVMLLTNGSNNVNAGTFAMCLFPTGALNFYNSTSPLSSIFDTGDTAPNPIFANVWNHLALVKKGSKMRAFCNGVGVESPKTLTDVYPSRNLTLGSWSGTTTIRKFIGKMDSVRIVNHLAVYWDDFIPPAAPLDLI